MGVINKSEKDVYNLNNGTSDFKAYNKNSDMSGIFVLGAEYHFKGTKRLSPYVGAEAGVTFGNNKYHSWNTDNSDYQKRSTPWIGAKVGAFTGVDIYILENFYCGLELGLVYDYNRGLTNKLEYSRGNTITKNEDKDFTAISAFNLGFAPTLRLGWKF